MSQTATQQTLIKQGRLFLISRVAAFLQYILAYLQHLAGLVTTGLLLLLLAATSYPFQPREPLLLFGWARTRKNSMSGNARCREPRLIAACYTSFAAPSTTRPTSNTTRSC